MSLTKRLNDFFIREEVDFVIPEPQQNSDIENLDLQVEFVEGVMPFVSLYKKDKRVELLSCTIINSTFDERKMKYLNDLNRDFLGKTLFFEDGMLWIRSVRFEKEGIEDIFNDLIEDGQILTGIKDSDFTAKF